MLLLKIFHTVPDNLLFLYAMACMLITALVLSSLGFKKLVYFISIGYGLSVAGISLFITILYFPSLNALFFLEAGLAAVYGLRLAGYLIVREKAAGYRKEQREIDTANRGSSFLQKAVIWLGVSLLYVCMTTPLLGIAHELFSPSRIPVLWPVAGCALMLLGISIEALADYQKSQFKKAHPHSFCTAGLYQYMRCPNYFGEILFWTGLFLSGISVYSRLWFLIPSLIGYVCIILIMIGSTKRLEAKQSLRYGEEQAFRDYTQRVPILIPFLPVYTFAHIKIYLG